ncbi:YciI family protein [Micromonospora sp. NPDC050417]|uniref:YciI family protein n=1 Tax=Micromonospora sp. NPDC050417 TaxID=3364280 RepID=UPI0037933DF7
MVLTTKRSATMRYLALLRAAKPDTPVPPELMAAITKLGEEATNSGSLLDTAGLAPSTAGARVTVSAGNLSVTDGPFAEAKEVISYALYEVRTRAEAVEWTSRFMTVHRDLWPGWEGEAEVLKVYGPEDFAPAREQ